GKGGCGRSRARDVSGRTPRLGTVPRHDGEGIRRLAAANPGVPARRSRAALLGRQTPRCAPGTAVGGRGRSVLRGPDAGADRPAEFTKPERRTSRASGARGGCSGTPAARL